MPEDLLATFEPQRHLRKLVFVISCTIRVLGELNVKSFRILGIVLVVRRAEELDRVDVVVE